MSPIEHIASGAEKIGIGHSPEGYDRDVLLKILHGDTPSRITFTKANGETRIMLCSLNPGWMPADLVVTHPGEPAEVNESIVTVWDIDCKHWKAIRMDRITSVETLE